MSDVFKWETPPDTSEYGQRWFPARYRKRLDAEPGRWGRIAINAGNHVHPELRKRFPDYEFIGRRTDAEDEGPARQYAIYARRRAEA